MKYEGGLPCEAYVNWHEAQGLAVEVQTLGACTTPDEESDSGNQPPFRTRDGAVTIWLYIIGEREVDGVCRAVFALHEQMDHGAGLAPEEVADFAQRERRGFVDRRDHVAFR